MISIDNLPDLVHATPDTYPPENKSCLLNVSLRFSTLWEVFAAWMHGIFFA